MCVQKDMEEDRDIFTEEKSRNRVSISTYFNYFRAGGSYVALVALMSIFILGEVITSLCHERKNTVLFANRVAPLQLMSG